MKPLMVLGTGSHVGKSTLTAALCRIFSDDGFRVAPFKAQNMSLNSAATPDGCEIGRAQALQAEACRIAARAEMNPVLIKPSTDTSSQVIVLGRVWGQATAADYYRSRVEELFPLVVRSFRTLAAEHDLVVLEGAGSPAEINLKARDIVNMRMAHAADAACVLVGDIDRGGVFASLLGTLELLEPEERASIRGFIINKFRGDPSLLAPGIRMIEDRIGIPCMGVVPYVASLGLDEEDSVSLEQRPNVRQWTGVGPDRPLRVAVIALPHLSNFTDFDSLAAEPSVGLAHVTNPEELLQADVIILPGTKQTLHDLDWLRRTGLAASITQRQNDAILVGICGGMQMMGSAVQDTCGVETGNVVSAEGLGVLPIRTRLGGKKVTRRATGVVAAPVLGQVYEGTSVQGYEIHLGKTDYLNGAQPFARIKREGVPGHVPDGAVGEGGRVFGTYLHGLFDDDAFRHAFINAARAQCQLAPPVRLVNVSAEREARIDRLASEVRRSLRMDLIYGTVNAAAMTADAAL